MIWGLATAVFVVVVVLLLWAFGAVYERGVRDGYEQADVLHDSPFGTLVRTLTSTRVHPWEYNLPQGPGTLHLSAQTLGELAVLVHNSEIGPFADQGRLEARQTDREHFVTYIMHT